MRIWIVVFVAGSIGAAEAQQKENTRQRSGGPGAAAAQSFGYPVSGAWAFIDPNDRENTQRACGTFEKSRASGNVDDVTGTLIFFERNKRFDYGGYINGYEHTVTSVQVVGKDEFRITERFYDDGEGGGRPGNRTRTFRIRLGADDRFQMIEGKLTSAYTKCPSRGNLPAAKADEKPKVAEAAVAVAGAVCTIRDGNKCLSEEQYGRCLLKVGGKKYLNGTCNINMSSDGSFSVGTGSERRKPSKFFAYVNKNGDETAEGSWNGIHGAGHAQESLGLLRKEGSACWVNSTAKVCGWR